MERFFQSLMIVDFYEMAPRYCAAHINGHVLSFILCNFIAKKGVIKTEPHGWESPSAILNHRSPLPGLTTCGKRLHSGKPGRGEQPIKYRFGDPPAMWFYYSILQILYSLTCITKGKVVVLETSPMFLTESV